MFLMMAITMPALIYAENETTDDSVSETEARILSDETGAQVRLLQLQERINLQIENANTIIQRIEDENITDVDTQILEEIVVELKAISVDIDSIDFNKTAEELASEFVALKVQAIDLSKEFKDIVRGIFNDDVKEQLKERIEENKRLRIEIKNERIEKLRLEYNSKKVDEIAKNLGIEVQQIRNRLESGDADISQIREEILSRYRNLSNEDRKDAVQKLREENAKKRVMIEKLREDISQNQEKIREEIKLRINNTRLEIKEGRIRYSDDNIRFEAKEGEVRVRATQDSTPARIGDMQFTKIKVDVRVGRETQVEIENQEQIVREFKIQAKDPEEAVAQIAEELNTTPDKIMPYLDVRYRED